MESLRAKAYQNRMQFAADNYSLARTSGIAGLIAQDEFLNGREITLNGQRAVNFGSCSYMGLEMDMRLKNAACNAIQKYGTQFSSSRAYVSAPLYRELEQLLCEITECHVIIAPTTTLAHMSAIPTMVGARDAVVYDAQVHASVQANLPELLSRNIPCMSIKHGRPDLLERQIQKLSALHDRVYYLCDGVYSMHGDILDVHGLYNMLGRNPSMFAYVDDAHGAGWSGRRGAGTVLGVRSIHERMIVVFGLSKSFAASGGVIATSNLSMADKIRSCGRSMIFSGPLQPAQLGAGIASAKIHLSDELSSLQSKVDDRIRRFDKNISESGLLDRFPSHSPIRYIPIGNEQESIESCARLLSNGFYVNIAMYPAVQKGKAGVRVVFNAHQTIEDIDRLSQLLIKEIQNK